MDTNSAPVNQVARHAPQIVLPQLAPKQPWHKPTLIYVPLQVTAEGSGTQDDGLASSTGG